MKRLVSTVQFCPSAPLINELECISFLVPSFGPSMDRVVAAFSTKQRLLRGARTRGEDNFILATLINCAQTARCLLVILAANGSDDRSLLGAEGRRKKRIATPE